MIQHGLDATHGESAETYSRRLPPFIVLKTWQTLWIVAIVPEVMERVGLSTHSSHTGKIDRVVAVVSPSTEKFLSARKIRGYLLNRVPSSRSVRRGKSSW